MSPLSLPGRHVGSVESISLRSDLIIPRTVSISQPYVGHVLGAPAIDVAGTVLYDQICGRLEKCVRAGVGSSGQNPT